MQQLQHAALWWNMYIDCLQATCTDTTASIVHWVLSIIMSCTRIIMIGYNIEHLTFDLKLFQCGLKIGRRIMDVLNVCCIWVLVAFKLAFRSANLPTRLYILLALISFLMIAWRQIISGSTGPSFAIFSPKDTYLFVNDRSLSFFRFRKRRNHGNKFWAKLAKWP